MNDKNFRLDRRKAIERLTMILGAAAIMPVSWAKTSEGLPIRIPQKMLSLTKPVTAITLGAGNRGNVYGNFALEYPDRLHIVGVAEPIESRRENYIQKHRISEDKVFHTWEDVFEKGKIADAIIITTPDDLHYGPCMKALAKGYDILLEKPISPSERECRDILSLAEKTGRIVAVCHVLRYAPYFVKLREIIQSGILGKVVSIQHFEPIHHVHMSHSYVRGNWHNSLQSTPIILAKSCHDLDIIKWMLGKRSTHIQAFAHLSWFNEKNAPEGSTPRCTDGCLAENQCPYSALKIYLKDRSYLHHFDLSQDKDKHGDEILHFLKTSNYGRCVYQMDNDQPDHYVTNILFEGDVTASFSMEAFTSYHGRRTRIMGSLGDITGDMSSFNYTDFLTGKSEEWSLDTDSHGGGDWNLVNDWVEAIDKQDSSLLTSTIADSIESHLMGFKAEESRKTKTVQKINL